MDDDVAVVEDGPAAATGIDAVEGERADVLLEFEFFEQVVLDCLCLTQGVYRGNDEVVGKGGLFMYVQQDDVGGLLVLDLFEDLPRECDAVQGESPLLNEKWAGILSFDLYARLSGR